VAAGLAGAAAFASSALKISLPLAPLASVLAAMLIVTLLAAWRLRSARAVSDVELFAHLAFDVAALTVVLYCTGGSTNPFAPLYLVPLTLTAAVLPGRYAWAMTFITIACYSLLLLFYVPLPVCWACGSVLFWARC
jgi:two-component system sensor histidine kinase RegB